jgi:GT2 family glycosyltransferase
MSTIPETSILISAFEQLDLTKRCLEDIRTTLDGKIAYEVILVDDASSSQTREKLESLLKPPHKLLLNRSPRGFGHNNNLAAKEAAAPFLCLLNNDVFVQGDWLAPMLRVFQDYPDAGMVGNLQRRQDNNLYDHMGIIFAPEGKPRHFGQHFKTHPFKEKVREWSAVTAACCVCRRETFLGLGGFDEIFINGCEDVDLCLRMAGAGYKNYVAHDSEVIHIKGATEGRKTHNTRNAEILSQRWGVSIRANQSIRDQRLHAWTYLGRFLAKPVSCHAGKLLHALLIQLGLVRLA